MWSSMLGHRESKVALAVAGNFNSRKVAQKKKKGLWKGALIAMLAKLIAELEFVLPIGFWTVHGQYSTSLFYWLNFFGFPSRLRRASVYARSAATWTRHGSISYFAIASWVSELALDFSIQVSRDSWPVWIQFPKFQFRWIIFFFTWIDLRLY